VVIYPKDLDSVDLYALEDFLDSTCFWAKIICN
jgi:hypothetical protein